MSDSRQAVTRAGRKAFSMKSTRFVFSMSFVIAVALLAVVVGIVVGKTSAGGSETGSAGPGRISGKRIDVIVKATDSSFWQSMFAGSKQAAGDLGVDVGLFGPTSETDVNTQVQLIENS